MATATPANQANGSMNALLQQFFPGFDLSQHDSSVSSVRKLNAAFIGVTALIVSLRMLVRLRLLKHTGIDDILMVLAGIFAIAFSVMCILATYWGLGHHEWDLNLTRVIDLNKRVVQYLWVAQVMYATALSLVKVSIIASFLRIFPQRPFRLTMWAMLICISLVWVCSILVTIFQCRPISSTWNFTDKKRKCIQVANYYYFSTAFSILTDLMLCLLPLPLFWKIQLPRKEKIIVCGLFLVGLFASVASILRITELKNLLSKDITAEAVPVVNWSVVEVGVGIICACVPSLKPLFKMWVPRLFSSAQQSEKGGGAAMSGGVGGSAAMRSAAMGGPPSRAGVRVTTEYEMDSKKSSDWMGQGDVGSKQLPIVTTRAYAGNAEDDDTERLVRTQSITNYSRRLSSSDIRAGRHDTGRVMGRVDGDMV